MSRALSPGKTGPYGRTVRPVGAEYVGKDGYVMVKVRERARVPGSKDCWELKHRHVWERANGREVPEGCVVMFRDRDNRNFDPANLACVPRGTMQAMNQLVADDPALRWYDADSFEAVRLIAETRRAETRLKRTVPRRCGVCGREFVPDTGYAGFPGNQRTCRECLNAGRKAGKHGEASS